MRSYPISRSLSYIVPIASMAPVSTRSSVLWEKEFLLTVNFPESRECGTEKLKFLKGLKVEVSLIRCVLSDYLFIN